MTVQSPSHNLVVPLMVTLALLVIESHLTRPRKYNKEGEMLHKLVL